MSQRYYSNFLHRTTGMPITKTYRRYRILDFFQKQKPTLR